MAFKRSDWNDIIQQINDVLQNPPPDTDCEPLPTLEEVGEKHRWSKADIQAAQDALKATCEDISFSDIPELWKQSIIDEITDAIGQAWCNCEPDDDNDCTEEAIAAEHNAEFVIFSNGPPRVSCEADFRPPLLVRDSINGMQIGQAGIFLRVWRLFRRNYRNDGVIQQSGVLASGVLSCQGVLTYTGPEEMAQESGVFCGVCCPGATDDFCSDVLATCQALLEQPSTFYSEWFIRIDTGAAFCALEDDECL